MPSGTARRTRPAPPRRAAPPQRTAAPDMPRLPATMRMRPKRPLLASAGRATSRGNAVMTLTVAVLGVMVHRGAGVVGREPPSSNLAGPDVVSTAGPPRNLTPDGEMCTLQH